MADDAPAIFEALIAERGGRSRFQLAQFAITKALAELLATADPDPKTVAQLASLLPERAAPGVGPALDLGRLTTHELRMLRWIMDKASGKHEDKPERVRSKRRDVAERLYQLLDFVQAQCPSEYHGPEELEEEDRHELRGLVDQLFHPTVLQPWRLWQAAIDDVIAWPLKRRIDDLHEKLAGVEHAARLIDGEVARPGPQRALPKPDDPASPDVIAARAAARRGEAVNHNPPTRTAEAWREHVGPYEQGWR